MLQHTQYMKHNTAKPTGAVDVAAMMRTVQRAKRLTFAGLARSYYWFNFRPSMQRLILFCLFIAFGFASPALAQEPVAVSDSVVLKDGQRFKVHFVQPRQTVYAIARAYGVQMNQLVFANPTLMDGIKPGQYLLVPESGSTPPDPSKSPEGLRSDGRHLLYTVPAKKTLYSIAKDYDVTMSELMEINPELQAGLKEGMTIRIPVRKMADATAPDGIPLTGMPPIQRVERPASKTGPAKSRPDDTIRIAVLLPLMLAENDTIRDKWWPGLEPRVSKKSISAIEFLEGVLLAADSLRAAGVPLSLTIHDTERSGSRIKDLFAKGNFNRADLIIGPLFADEFKVAAQEALDRCIPIFSPTVQGKDITKWNDYVLKGMASHDVLTIEMGRYVGSLDSVKAGFVIHYGRPEDQYLQWRFRKGVEATAKSRPPSLPTVNLAKSGRDSLKSVLSAREVNHLIMLTNDQARVASLLREVHRWAEQYRIVMYVPDTWLQFKNVDLYYLDKMQATFATNDYSATNSPEYRRVVDRCMQRYSGEPTDLTLRGYDCLMHLAPLVPNIKNDGPMALDGRAYTGLIQQFKWARAGIGGMENTDAHVVRFNNLSLNKVDK